MTYFLDANIISYIIKQIPSVLTRLQDLVRNNASIKIPIVAYYEVKRGLLANKTSNRLAIFDTQIKQLGSIIEDADLFIGASALENNAILITNNARHLQRIPNLQIEILK
ncbi:MAG: hypothetical protein IJX45_04185 [Spirochaetaceae bacterium]|nr:hypothetical protein [Spirochaetaceae bacterium]